jgi:predicted peptidase
MTTRREFLPTFAGGVGLVSLAAMPETAAASAKSSAPELRRLSYASQRTGAGRDYFVYLPRGFNTQKSWPVILFLHGDGERGDAKADLDYVLCHGPLYEAWIQKRDLPFVIISPQLPLFGLESGDFFKGRNRSWIPLRQATGAPSRPLESTARVDMPMQGVVATPPEGESDADPNGWQQLDEELLMMVDHAVKELRGDSKRVYLTGLSSGGFGTWWLASRHPDRFAAIAPIVGYGRPSFAAPIAAAKLPLWQFAGGRDPAVPLPFFFELMNALEKQGHPEVRFTIQEDLGHFTWVRVYRGNDLYDWMLTHSRA